MTNSHFHKFTSSQVHKQMSVVDWVPCGLDHMTHHVPPAVPTASCLPSKSSYLQPGWAVELHFCTHPSLLDSSYVNSCTHPSLLIHHTGVSCAGTSVFMHSLERRTPLPPAGLGSIPRPRPSCWCRQNSEDRGGTRCCNPDT